MGEQDGYEFLRLDPEDNKSYVRVETAGQYLEMRRKGAAPFSTYDITMNSWFVRILSPLRLPIPPPGLQDWNYDLCQQVFLAKTSLRSTFWRYQFPKVKRDRLRLIENRDLRFVPQLLTSDQDLSDFLRCPKLKIPSS